MTAPHLKTSLTVGSLFAGIGGFDLGLERAGFDIAWQVEINAFSQRVLERRWPGVQRFDDVRTVGLRSDDEPGSGATQSTIASLESRNGHCLDAMGPSRIDLLCGGFPCQDLSVAGKRTGLAGARSGLFSEILRIAKITKPTWGFFENVPGLFSSHAGRDMASVLEGLRECWPVVGYRVLDSQYFGVAQRRRRVFFIGGPTEHSVEQVLFESEGGGGDLAASSEAGTDLAASLRSRSSRPGISPPGRGGEDDMNVICQAITNLGSGGPDDNEAQANHLVAHAITTRCGTAEEDGTGRGAPLVTHTLTGDGFDASEDGTGRGTPLVPIAEVGAKTQMGSGRNGCGIGHDGDPMFTLQAGKQHAVGVRRLTPTECERLQGFPNGWTCLCQPLESYDPNACTCPDGRRYQALGNAVTVPVISWFGRRILHASRTRA